MFLRVVENHDSSFVCYRAVGGYGGNYVKVAHALPNSLASGLCFRRSFITDAQLPEVIVMFVTSAVDLYICNLCPVIMSYELICRTCIVINMSFCKCF